MTNLEIMAKKLFEEYSLKKTGKVYEWEFLQQDRKTEWLKDLLLVVNLFAAYLEKGIPPVPKLGQRNTSYNMGFNDGVSQERSSLRQLIHELQKESELDYLDFIKED